MENQSLGPVTGSALDSELNQCCLITDPLQPDNPIIYVTAEFEDQTGYSKEEILGLNCRFLQGPGTDPAAVALIRDAVANHRELTLKILNYRKDGSAFMNRLSIRPVFDDDGKLWRFVSVQRVVGNDGS